MCGLSGFFCYGKARLTPKEVRWLHESQASKGRMAAGYAYYETEEEKIFFNKQKGSVDLFHVELSPEDLEHLAAAPWGLLHCRATTKGSEHNNENNHPVLGHGWVVTHNGTLTNDDDLFKHFDQKREAEVDTVAINLLLSQGKTPEESLAHFGTISGKATIAVANTETPHQVILARARGNPIHLGWDARRKIIVWGTESGATTIVSPLRVGAMPFVPVTVLYDQEAYVLDFKEKSMNRYRFTLSPFFRKGEVRQWMGIDSYPRGITTPDRFPPFRPVLPAPPRVVNPTVGTTGSHFVELRENYIGMGKPPPWFERVPLAWTPNITDAYTTGIKFVDTCYGRWSLGTRLEELVFRAHKRIRHFWDTLPELSGLALPPDDELKKILHNFLPLEKMALFTKLDAHMKVAEEGLLCPWCGVMADIAEWKKWNYTCDWCEILSIIPKLTP